MQQVTETNVVSEFARVEDVFFIIIPLVSSGIEIPIPFRRLQCSIRKSVSMSINKSQEQTPSDVGFHLEEACFSYWEVCFRYSRLGCEQNFFVFDPQVKTNNLV